MTDRPDPYSATPMWRPDPPCGRRDCPCAVPCLPCRRFEGIDETDPWCPCCGWNEAAHEVSRHARHLRVQRWRDERAVVVEVRQVRDGLDRGWWRLWRGDRPPLLSARTYSEAVTLAHEVAGRITENRPGPRP